MWLDFDKGWMASWPLKTFMYKWVEIIRLIKCHASSSQCMAWRDWEMPFCLCTDVLHWLGFAHFRGKLQSHGHPWRLAWASILMETHQVLRCLFHLNAEVLQQPELCHGHGLNMTVSYSAITEKWKLWLKFVLQIKVQSFVWFDLIGGFVLYLQDWIHIISI